MCCVGKTRATLLKFTDRKESLKHIGHQSHIKPQEFQLPLNFCWCQHHKNVKEAPINVPHLQNEFNSKSIFGSKWEEGERILTKLCSVKF